MNRNNPYTITLAVLGGVSFLAGFGIARSASDPSFGIVLLLLGSLAGVGALVVGGIGWALQHRVVSVLPPSDS